jgi:hypothetical protein
MKTRLRCSQTRRVRSERQHADDPGLSDGFAIPFVSTQLLASVDLEDSASKNMYSLDESRF